MRVNPKILGAGMLASAPLLREYFQFPGAFVIGMIFVVVGPVVMSLEKKKLKP